MNRFTVIARNEYSLKLKIIIFLFESVYDETEIGFVALLALWNSTRHRIVDSALVRSSADFEKSSVAPFLVPRVHHQPIRCAFFFSPSDQFHGVSSQARSVLCFHVHPWKSRGSCKTLVSDRILIIIFIIRRLRDD